MKNFIFFYLLIILFSSCKKDEFEHLGPYATGDIVGRVNLKEAYENDKVLNDHSGVKVTAKGYITKTTTTDEDGYFKINMRSGTIQLIFEKEGFGKTSSFINHLGGQETIFNNPYSPLILYKKSTGSVSASGSYEGNGNIYLQYSYSNEDSINMVNDDDGGYIVFYSDAPSVSSENFDYSTIAYRSYPSVDYKWKNHINVYGVYPYNTKIYLKIYYGAYTKYYDNDYNYTFTCLSSNCSETIEITVN